MRNSNTRTITQQLLSLRNILQARIDAIDNLLEVLSQESSSEEESPNRQASNRRREERQASRARARVWAAEQQANEHN